MITEIEKKYAFNKDDYQKIVDNCIFEGEINIKDYYLDNSDYILFKNKYYLRLRDGIYELKISKLDKSTGLVRSKEIIGDDEIDEILKNTFGISIDETAGVVFVETTREKYSYILNGEKINIDIDSFQYGKRYEIEIISDSKTQEEVNDIIVSFRKKLGLYSSYDQSAGKIMVCARNQNIEIYEIMKSDDF